MDRNRGRIYRPALDLRLNDVCRDTRSGDDTCSDSLGRRDAKIERLRDRATRHSCNRANSAQESPGCEVGKEAAQSNFLTGRNLGPGVHQPRNCTCHQGAGDHRRNDAARGESDQRGRCPGGDNDENGKRSENDRGLPIRIKIVPPIADRGGSIADRGGSIAGARAPIPRCQGTGFPRRVDEPHWVVHNVHVAVERLRPRR